MSVPSIPVDRIRVVVVAVGLAFCARSALAQSSVFVQQTRYASADAVALWPSGGESEQQNLSLSAQDFEFFSTEQRAQASTQHASGDAKAEHHSSLSPDFIHSRGLVTAGASASSPSNDSSAGAAANTHFEIRFDVTEETQFVLDGHLAAGAAKAHLEITGPGGTILLLDYEDEGHLLDLAGTLLVGSHTLIVYANIACEAAEDESCWSSAGFDVRLSLGNPEVATEKTSFGAIKSLYD